MSVGRVAGSRSVAAQFVALALTWGASFLFIKISLGGLSPVQVVFGRLAAGAVALILICLVTRQRLPRDRQVWAHLTVVAALLCVVPFFLFAWAQQHISSALASIYNATTPLMTMLVALAALPQERPDRARLAGLGMGFLGVLVVLGPWRAGLAGSAGAQLACLGATLSYGVAFVYLRRFVSPRGLGAVPVATIQVGLAAVITAGLLAVRAGQPMDLDPAVIAAILTLGGLGTGLAYVWNTNVVAAWGATNASTVTYLTPLVGVTLGVLVAAEDVHWNEPLGGLVVIVGIALSQGRNPFTALARARSSST